MSPTIPATITTFQTSGAIAGIVKWSCELRMPTNRPLRPSSTTIGNSTWLSPTHSCVSSGVKSLLDVSATLEELETRGIPVIGYGTDRFPLFYQRDSPHPLPDRVDDPATVAALAATHWGFARAAGVVVANPVAEEVALSADEVEPAVDQALAEAEAAGIRGADVTPFVLGRVHELTEGRSLAANRRLIEDNAALAAEIARAYYAE